MKDRLITKYTLSRDFLSGYVYQLKVSFRNDATVRAFLEGALLTCILALFYWNLPYFIVSGDGSWYVIRARNLFDNLGYINEYGELENRRAPLLPILLALGLKLFGIFDTSLFHVIRLFYFANIFLTYFIARKMFSASGAIFSVYIVLISYPIYKAGMDIMPDIVQPTFILAALAFMIMSMDRKPVFYSSLAGISLGLGFLVKESTIIFLPLALAALCWWQINVKIVLKSFFAFALSYLITIGYWIFYSYMIGTPLSQAIFGTLGEAGLLLFFRTINIEPWSFLQLSAVVTNAHIGDTSLNPLRYYTSILPMQFGISIILAPVWVAAVITSLVQKTRLGFVLLIITFCSLVLTGFLGTFESPRTGQSVFICYLLAIGASFICYTSSWFLNTAHHITKIKPSKISTTNKYAYYLTHPRIWLLNALILFAWVIIFTYIEFQSNPQMSESTSRYYSIKTNEPTPTGWMKAKDRDLAEWIRDHTEPNSRILVPFRFNTSINFYLGNNYEIDYMYQHIAYTKGKIWHPYERHLPLIGIAFTTKAENSYSSEAANNRIKRWSNLPQHPIAIWTINQNICDIERGISQPNWHHRGCMIFILTEEVFQDRVISRKYNYIVLDAGNYFLKPYLDNHPGYKLLTQPDCDHKPNCMAPVIYSVNDASIKIEPSTLIARSVIENLKDLRMLMPTREQSIRDLIFIDIFSWDSKKYECMLKGNIFNYGSWDLIRVDKTLQSNKTTDSYQSINTSFPCK